MFAITIRFLNGKYHATPWGKHVNEGAAEWPPSIWRLMRAMIASWKRSLPDLPNGAVWPVLQKMVKTLPGYRLPAARLAHSRHYMPAPSKGTLVMDTFVIVGDEPVEIIWKNLTLDEAEARVVGDILKNLHYFGRAESWCSAEISAAPREPNCVPHNGQDAGNADLVYVLVPRRNVRFTDGMGKNADADLESITVTTGQLHGKKYLDPPGGKWAPYLRPRNIFGGRPPAPGPRAKPIHLVRYAVAGPLRPRIKDTVKVGDVAKSACMSVYGKGHRGKTSPVFSGKDEGGAPLKGHGHAFYLPTYESQNGEIDHLTIISAEGFGEKELGVLFAMRELRGRKLRADLLFQGCGSVDDFSSIPILRKSRKWASSTPLVLSRHIKRRGKKPNVRVVDGLDEQVRAEIKNRYGDSYRVKAVTELGGSSIGDTAVRPFEFYRWRSHGSVGADIAYNVRLEFEEPVSGPITLGYSSHYGLGMFVPDGADCR